MPAAEADKGWGARNDATRILSNALGSVNERRVDPFAKAELVSAINSRKSLVSSCEVHGSASAAFVRKHTLLLVLMYVLEPGRFLVQ